MAAEDYIEFDAWYGEMDDSPPYPMYQQRYVGAKKSLGHPYGGAIKPSPGQPRNHGTYWTDEQDAQLENLWWNHTLSLPSIAQKLGRTVVSIESRLRKHGIDPEGSRNRELVTSQPETKDPMMTDFQHLLALLQHGYTTVDVCFPENPGQRYTYKIPSKMAEGLEPKHYLVVPSRNEFKLVQVVEVHPTPRIDVKKPLALKWVVQRVDFTAYNDQTSREAEAIEKLQVAERAAAQKKALEVLLGSVENRDEILKLIQVG